MIDHVAFTVADLDRSRRFYEQALSPLGLRVLMDFGVALGFGGDDGKPFFWIESRHEQLRGYLHVAFAVPDRATADAFHAAALAAGGADNGAPGVRPQYHRDYYGAFVLDPDGHNVEAVCHCPD